MTKFINKTNSTLQIHSLAIRIKLCQLRIWRLKIGQIVNILFEKVQGTFLSNTMINSKESVQAIF